MNKFLALFLKELRELLNKQLLISFIIMVLLFRIIGEVNKSAIKKIEEKQKIGVVIQDNGLYGPLVEKALENSFIVSELKRESEEDWISVAYNQNIRTLVIIPENFSKKIENKEKATVKVFTIARTLGLGERIQKTLINNIIKSISESIARSQLSKVFKEPELEFIKEPVSPEEYVNIKGKTYRVSSDFIFGYLTTQSTLIPIILFLLLIMTSQMIAAAMGQEKENKTLETLLTTPVSRFSIILAKMLSSVLIAGVFAAGYLYGFRNYMFSFESQFQGIENIAREMGITLSSSGLIAFGFMIFLALISGLLMSMLISIFVQDTKSAQVAITPIMILLLIPYFLSFTVDVSELSSVAKIVVYLIPFTHPFYFYRFYMLGNYKDIALGFGYLVILNIILAIIILKLFSTDILITSRLDLSRRR
jgi:ABC-2 type transport system permease protein